MINQQIPSVVAVWKMEMQDVLSSWQHENLGGLLMGGISNQQVMECEDKELGLVFYSSLK